MNSWLTRQKYLGFPFFWVWNVSFLSQWITYIIWKLIPRDGWILVSLLTIYGFQNNCLKYLYKERQERWSFIPLFSCQSPEKYIHGKIRLLQSFKKHIYGALRYWGKTVSSREGFSSRMYTMVWSNYLEVQYHISMLTWMGHIICPVGWQRNYAAFFLLYFTV